MYIDMQINVPDCAMWRARDDDDDGAKSFAPRANAIERASRLPSDVFLRSTASWRLTPALHAASEHRFSIRRSDAAAFAAAASFAAAAASAAAALGCLAPPM